MRHRSFRYDIRRPVNFRFSRDGSRPSTGTGSTLNISRRGLLFQTEDKVEVGTKIQMTIHIGPGQIEASQDVTLQVEGITVRTEPGKVAVSIKRHRLSPVSQCPVNGLV